MRSFDAPRVRQVPTTYKGMTPDGTMVDATFAPRHLVIAVKESCDGCATLLEAPDRTYDALADEVLFVASSHSNELAWLDSSHRRLVAPELLKALEVQWPPLWMLIDGTTGTVIAEGVPFGVAHLINEVGRFR